MNTKLSCIHCIVLCRKQYCICSVLHIVIWRGEDFVYHILDCSVLLYPETIVIAYCIYLFSLHVPCCYYDDDENGAFCCCVFNQRCVSHDRLYNHNMCECRMRIIKSHNTHIIQYHITSHHTISHTFMVEEVMH